MHADFWNVHCAQAYKNQCACKDRIFCKTMAFIPYAYKNQKPEAFLRAMQLHNKNLSETWVVKIQGITEEAINNCTSHLLDHEGINTITPTKKNLEIYLFTDRKPITPTAKLTDKGEWKILINKKALPVYQDILDIVQNVLDIVYDILDNVQNVWTISEVGGSA